VEFITFLSLAISLVLSALTLYRTRHDLTGQNHAAGLDANGNYGEEGGPPVVAMYTVGKEQQLGQQPQPVVYEDTHPVAEQRTGQFVQQSMQGTYYPEPPAQTQTYMNPGTLVEEEEVQHPGGYGGVSPSHTPVHEAPVSHTPAPGRV